MADVVWEFSFFPMVVYNGCVLAPDKQDPNQLSIWSMETCRLLRRHILPPHGHLPHSRVLLGDEFIVIGFDGGEVRVYNLNTFELVSSAKALDEPVFALCHFKDHIIAGGGTDMIANPSIQLGQVKLIECKNIISAGVSSIASVDADFITVCWMAGGCTLTIVLRRCLRWHSTITQ